MNRLAETGERNSGSGLWKCKRCGAANPTIIDRCCKCPPSPTAEAEEITSAMRVAGFEALHQHADIRVFQGVSATALSAIYRAMHKARPK